MKLIKLSVLALLVTVLSFIVNPLAAKTTNTTNTQFSVNQVSKDETVRYVYINGDLYEVHYDEDGRIMLIQPAE